MAFRFWAMGDLVNAEFQNADGGAFAALDRKFNLVGSGRQVMSEHHGTGVVQSLAVSMMQVDASFAFPVDCELEDSSIRTGVDESTDCLAFELEADGFFRTFAVKKRPTEVPSAFSAGKTFPIGFGKFPTVGQRDFFR